MNAVHFVAASGKASLDCEVTDTGAVVTIVTNATTLLKDFTNKQDAIDYSLGMIPVLEFIAR